MNSSYASDRPKPTAYNRGDGARDLVHRLLLLAGLLFAISMSHKLLPHLYQ